MLNNKVIIIASYAIICVSLTYSGVGYQDNTLPSPAGHRGTRVATSFVDNIETHSQVKCGPETEGRISDSLHLSSKV